MITVKIDVTKIDKARLFTGAKGTYLDLILIETPGGQYGDYMVKQSITKEERLAKVQMPILGNAKNMGGGARPSAPAPQHAKANTGADQDVPW
jgi:hypothetical protein